MVEKMRFEYDYLQSRLVIVRFQTEALFTASLMYKLLRGDQKRTFSLSKR